MEPPKSRGFADLQAAKADVFKAMRPLKPDDLVRGQYEGYRQEKDVAPDSDVETFVRAAPARRHAALAGRAVLPARRQEAAQHRGRGADPVQAAAQALFEDAGGRPNYLRFRLQPTSSIALAARVKDVGKQLRRPAARAVRLRGPAPARKRRTTACWATRWPATARCSPASRPSRPRGRPSTTSWSTTRRSSPYKPGTWGPAEADALIAGDGGWQAPTPEEACGGNRRKDA